MPTFVPTRPHYAMSMSGVAWAAAAYAGDAWASGAGPLAAAAAVGALGAAALLAANRKRRPPTGRGTPMALGSSGRTPLWLTATALRGGLSISGESGRAKSLTSAVLDQWIAGGNGVVVCTADPAFADEIARMAAVAGRTEDFRRVDLADTGLERHRINPFAEVSEKGALRLLLAVVGSETLDRRTKALATSLIEAMTPALVELRDERMIDLRAGVFADHASLRKLVDMGDEKQYPDLRSRSRWEVASYLESLPGYAKDKGYAQPQTARDAHNVVAAAVKSALRPLEFDPKMSDRYDSESDVGIGDTVAGRRIVVLRVPSGGAQREAALRRYAVAIADEMARVDVAHYPEARFMALFAGLDAEMAALDLSGKGVVASSTKAMDSLSTRVEVPSRGRAVLRDGGGEKRFAPASYVAGDAYDTTPGLRVVLHRPSRDSVVQKTNLPEIMAVLIDPENAKKNVEDEARAKVSGDPEFLRMAKSIQASRKFGGVAGSCVAVADSALRKILGIDGKTALDTNFLAGLSPQEVSKRFDRYMALWGVKSELASQAFFRAAVVARDAPLKILTKFSWATPYSLVGIAELVSTSWGKAVIMDISNQASAGDEELRRALAWFEDSWFPLENEEFFAAADAVASVVNRILFGVDLKKPLAGRIDADDLSAAVMDMVFHRDARQEPGAAALLTKRFDHAVALGKAMSDRPEASLAMGGVPPYSLYGVVNFAAWTEVATKAYEACLAEVDGVDEQATAKLNTETAELVLAVMRDSSEVAQLIDNGMERAVKGMRISAGTRRSDDPFSALDDPFDPSDDGSWAFPPPEARPKNVPVAPGAVVKPKEEGIVVVPDSFADGIKKEDTKEGSTKKRSAAAMRSYVEMAGKRLPCAMVGDLGKVQESLDAEFPHLVEITSRILTEVSASTRVRFRPILLHGDPASGKTRYARRLCEALGVAPTVYPCGGAADASIGGTSAQWSTARASVPLQAVVRSAIANPCVVLDEISRTAGSGYNGSLTDVILGLTERESSRAYFDLFLEVEVDLSGVLWMATTNTLEGLDQALLSRFTKIEIPLPEEEHAAHLIARMSVEIAVEAGLPAEFAHRFTDAEVDMIAEAWGGGSIRRLRALMTKVVKAIDGNKKLAN